MRGFRRSEPKIDPNEWALTQSRTALRLADLFNPAAPDDPDADPDADPDPARDEATEATDPVVDDAAAGVVTYVASARPGRPRPPIVVEGAADEGSGPEPVAVMAPPGDNLEDETWKLPVDAAAPATTAPTAATAATTAAPSPADVARSLANVAPALAALFDPGMPVSAAPPAASKAAPGRAGASRSKAKPKPLKAAPDAFCPYCALSLQPAPTASRRCTGCLQRIVVKRVDGRTVYLTEAAVLIFDAERRRVASKARLTRERDRWLRLAAATGAPAERHARLAAARLSEQGVSAARTLYLSTVDRAFRAAKLDHDWEKAARIRRDNANALYRVAGSPMPPPADVLALFREGVAAELRGIAEFSRDAELISARCCDICRSDDRQIFRIARELRLPRLPHEGCPKGLCRCHWDLAARDRSTMRRFLKHRPGTESRTTSIEPNEPAPPA